MPVPSMNRFAILSASLSKGAAVLVSLFGAAMLAGWVFDIELLKWAPQSMVRMKANAAFAFLLSGFSLWFSAPGEKGSTWGKERIGQALAFLVALLGLLTLSEYVFGWDLGIDQLLAREAPGAFKTSSPGRMAPNAALNFLFLGGALLALGVGRGEWIASILALAAAAVAMLALMGYAYGENSLTGFVSYTHIAIHTAVAFVVLAAGILFRLGDRGVTGFVMSDSPGGAMARGLLPPVFAVPLVFGWLRLLGERAGLYGVEFGVALLVTASIVTLVVVVVRSAATLEKADVERKRAEEALRDGEEKLRISEERFRQLFEQNEEPLFLFRGGSTEILDVNPAAVQLYGYPREELVRGGLSLFVQPGDRPELLSAISGIQSDTILSVERATHLRSDGAKIIVSLRGKAICTESGFMVYCSVRDITTRIRMEEDAKLQQAQLIHANRMTSLGKVVSGVAHEINNPNNLVMFNAPLIVSAWEDAVPVLDAYYRDNGDFSLGGLPYSEMKEVVPKMAAGISDASARIKAIVENLKNFARRDTSRRQTAVQVNDVVRIAITILNHEILRATHRFKVSYGENLPPVMGSAQQLEQVVINLLNNAFQALPSNRHRIRVNTRLAPETGEVELCVEDEGVGMSSEVLERIKEPFFSTHLDSGGLGLGVSICRSIVREHKGTLEFESEVGKGTRAVVRLPGIGDALGIGGEDLASKIPSGR
jgi:PAS domain S-box-containing protein